MYRAEVDVAESQVIGQPGQLRHAPEVRKTGGVRDVGEPQGGIEHRPSDLPPVPPVGDPQAGRGVAWIDRPGKRLHGELPGVARCSGELRDQADGRPQVGEDLPERGDPARCGGDDPEAILIRGTGLPRIIEAVTERAGRGIGVGPVRWREWFGGAAGDAVHPADGRGHAGQVGRHAVATGQPWATKARAAWSASRSRPPRIAAAAVWSSR